MKFRLAAVFLLLALILSPRAETEADSRWEELAKAAKPPSPPAEWSQKRPTEEERREWQKTTLAQLSQEVAAKAKKFYETYPDHAKADEARKLEAKFSTQATTFKSIGEPAKADPFRKAYAEAVDKIRARRAEGPLGVANELEKQGRALAQEFPKQEEPWGLLFSAAAYAPTAKALDLYKEIEAGAPDPALKARAAAQVRKMGAVGRPFPLGFTAFDGRPVDLANLRGKVVLVDFWATWCGPCIAELPRVQAVYSEFHDKGFEILGINLDEDAEVLKRFMARNEMPWPQYFDGKGWGNKITQEHGIISIPTMYLVDKKGILRDTKAAEGLREKVRALLAE